MANENVAQIDFIVSLLRLGNERKDILPKFTEIYRTSEKTFNTRLKTARDRLQIENKAKEEIREALLPEIVKDEIEAQIASEKEIDLILSKIITGGIEVRDYVRGEAVIRDTQPMEIIAAADKLYKRRGSYAPTKVASTTKDGEDVEDPILKLIAAGGKIVIGGK